MKTRKGRFLWHFRQIHLPSHPCTLRSDTTCPVNCRSRDHLECVDAIRQTQFWKTWNGALLTIISNVDGNTALSEDWTRYTRFEILQRRPPQGHVGTWKSHQMPTRPGQILYPSEPPCLKNKGRKRKPNTDAAPNFKASSTLTQKMKSVKTLLDTSRGNWKDQHPRQYRVSHHNHSVLRMREETPRTHRVETLRFWTSKKIMEAEIQTLLNSHKDHTAERGCPSMCHNGLIHSDTSSESDEDTSSKSCRRQSGANSRICEFGANLHLASLMDLSHLKHSELAEYLQKFRGRVVLRVKMSKTTHDAKQSSLNKDHPK